MSGAPADTPCACGDQRRTRRTRRLLGTALVLSTAGSIGLVVAYWSDAAIQIQGLAMALATGGLALALGVWGRRAVPDRVAVEGRPPMPSDAGARALAARTAELDHEGLGRRRSLRALVGVAGASLFAAFLSPLRSLGPSPFPERRRTGWASGLRLVDEHGSPLRAGDLDVGSLVTAFPEGETTTERADSQIVLIRMTEDALRLTDEQRSLTVQGHVAYSKVCTHAGCPVGLYDADTNELLCPCHQSVFLASEGARPTFGPAARPLPQLPLTLDVDGYLVAADDFPEPVGPSFWSRPS